MVARRDDDQQHRPGIEHPGDPQRAVPGHRHEHGSDDHGIAEVKARDGGERVVERAENVRAEVERGGARDGVREAELGEPGRRGRIEDVSDERETGRDHEGRPHEREAVRMPAVHPDERDRGADEVEQHVGDPEQCRREGGRLDGLLDAALDVDADGLLERDDVARVPERGLDILAARTSDDLVEAVESREIGDLAGAQVRS